MDLITALTAAGGASAGGAADPNFNQTVLLLHGDGTNGAQNNTFLDSSTNNFTITRNGNTTQGSFTPFSADEGKWSNYFDGSGDYLTVPDNAAFDLGSGAFTIECFAYLNARAGAYDTLVGQWNNSSDSWLLVLQGNSLQFYGNGSLAKSETVTITLGQWYHFACTRDGSNNLRLYANGVKLGSDTAYSTTLINSTANPSIGSRGDGLGTTNFNGYMSSVRVLKGAAEYTGSTYTVPTSPLTAISNTSLLTCQSNRFVDNSSNAFAITANGNTSVQPFSPFAPSAAYSASVNGGSGYFDGTGDYLTVPDDADFDFGSGDFTISAWIYPQGSGAIIDQGGGGVSSNRSFEIYMSNSSTISNAYISSDGTYQSQYNLTGTTVPNAWNFVEFTRASGTLYLFVNGVQQSTASANVTIFNSTASVAIGNTSANTVNPYTGYISSLRVLKGTGASSSTIPTAPLTAVSGTELLCNFTNAGIFDNTGKNNLETVGDAQIDTTTVKYGTGSLKFDGTGDQLYIANSPALAMGTGDFTVEMWYYENTGVSGNKGLFDTRTVAGATNGFLLQRIDTKNLRVFTDASVVTTGINTIVQGTFQHIAVVRQSGTIRIYLDGVEKGNAANTQNFTNTDCWIGDNADESQKLNGYLDDIRVTRGVCRYPDGTTFTPPTKAFPDQ